MASRLSSRTPWDSVWKEALTQFLQSGLRLLFPSVAALVDWSEPAEVLDRELRVLIRKVKLPRGHSQFVDHLVRVKMLSGESRPLLLHLEVQCDRESGFEERIYLYHSWLSAIHKRVVATLVVLGDSDPNWRPSQFWAEYPGDGEVKLRFPTRKVLDFEGQIESLLKSPEPFALFLAACVKAIRTKGDTNLRYEWKRQLTEVLCKKGWDPTTSVLSFQMLDAIMILPEQRQRVYSAWAEELQERQAMKFISPTDRIALKDARKEGRKEGREEGRVEGREEGRVEGREEGRVEGREEGRVEGREEGHRESLNRFKGILIDFAVLRLGAIPDGWMSRIQSVNNPDELDELSEQLKKAENWSELESS